MSSSIDRENISLYYERLLKKERTDSRKVGWQSRASQELKFHEVGQVFAHERSPFTVYDVGCGLGSLRAFLNEHYPLARYSGCDISRLMIEQARRRHPGASLERRDILLSRPRTRFDYAVASGTFNICLKASKARWRVYVEKMLHRLYGIALKGIAVDFLSSLACGKLASEYHADPSELLRFAQRRLSPLAEIRHSESPGHFALFVYRASPAPRISRLRGPSLKSKSTIDRRGKNEP